MDKSDITFFDPKMDWAIVERGLPHWSQSGCVCFVTWRLNDSLPSDVIARIDQEIAAFLKSEGFDPHGDWKQQLAQHTSKRRGEIQWKLFTIRDRFLDLGYGACHLSDSRFSSIVFDSLKKFDMKRYFLTDTVVMPNHAQSCPFSVCVRR